MPGVAATTPEQVKHSPGSTANKEGGQGMAGSLHGQGEQEASSSLAGFRGELSQQSLRQCSRMASPQLNAKKTKSSLLVRKDVVTQTEDPQNHVAVQASGCMRARACQ